jgi:hypothetical protein
MGWQGRPPGFPGAKRIQKSLRTLPTVNPFAPSETPKTIIKKFKREARVRHETFNNTPIVQ